MRRFSRSPRATTRAFNFSSLPVALFGFEYKFNGDNEFVLVWSVAKDKGTMVNDVLDFHADGVQPGSANIVIKFLDSFKRLWFREIFLNRIHGVSVWIS